MLKFDINKTIVYWLSSAKYDLAVANALFMGHLALEKLLKAIVVKHKKAHAPFSHSLTYLAEKSGIKIPEPLLVKLREFMEFHFEARYPDANKAFYNKCTRDYTSVKLKEIKEAYKWLKAKL